MAAFLKLAEKLEERAAKIESINATYAARGTAPESAMAEWFVRYLDIQTNRETESRRVATRDQAIGLALDRKRAGCLIRSIVGPDGEEQWGEMALYK